MVLKKFVKLFVVFFLFSCNEQTKYNLYSISGNALGTKFNILYTSTSPLKGLTNLTDSVFVEINNSLSTYIETSDISKINKGLDFIKVDHHFINVFNKSKIIWKSTDGFFDPTIGLLTKAYGLGPKNNIQSSVKIDDLIRFTGFEKVSLKNNMVIKESKEIFLDFNAIAKGYCVDVISRMLKKNNITNHLVEIGGEMVASGKNQVTDAFWKVGITDPLNNSTNNFINRIELRNKALASSGNYRKFLIDKESGKKIVHTINPKTGDAFETNVLGASVIADDCITADAYATSFMAMPIKKSKEVISNLENIDVMIIYYDKNKNVKVLKSNGFNKLILD